MNEANKLKLGIFLLISIVLVVIGFIAAGSMKLFQAKLHAMTLLETSVEGLNIGSPVKYMGMPIGKITDMTMRPGGNGIAVYFEIDLSAIELKSGRKGSALLLINPQQLNEELDISNLNCFLNAAGIMGGTYLEISTQGSSISSGMPENLVLPRGTIFIPSRPSHIGNAIQNVSRMLDELEKVDFIQLADKLNETLNDFSRILHEGELLQTLKMVNSMCKNAEISFARLKIMMSEENVRKINRTVDSIDSGMQSLKTISDKEHFGSTISNLNAFLLEARSSLQKAEQTGQIAGNNALELKNRIENSLTKLDNLTRQLSILMEKIGDDPNQFVRGKSAAPVKK